MPRSIRLVVPEGAGPASGNRRSAERWAGYLHETGHDVRVLEATAPQGEYEGADLWIGLHAERSASALDVARRIRPDLPAVTVLSGTDLHRPHGLAERALEQLARSARIVALHPGAEDLLPPALHPRLTCIVQVPPGLGPRPLPPGPPRLAMLASLRPVKNTELVHRALELLPLELELEVRHAGAPLNEPLTDRARRVSSSDPRYTYLGEVNHRAALDLIGDAHGLLLPSHSEGGANVLSEALLLGRGVLASDVPGSRSLWCRMDETGFDPDDPAGLAARLRRFAEDAPWRAELAAAAGEAGQRLRSLDEAAAWAELVREVAS